MRGIRSSNVLTYVCCHKVIPIKSLTVLFVSLALSLSGLQAVASGDSLQSLMQMLQAAAQI